MNVKTSDNEEIHCLIIYPVADFGHLPQDDMENMSVEEVRLYNDFLNTPKIEDFNDFPLWESATQIPRFPQFPQFPQNQYPIAYSFPHETKIKIHKIK